MKSFKYSLLAIIATAAVAISASAQQPTSGTSSDQQMPGMGNMQGMQTQSGKKTPSNQIMQGCHNHMQSMVDANAQTIEDIEAAKQSNDSAKMRMALDEAEKALSPSNQHMKGCMKMLEPMHGKSGMGSSSTKDGGQANKPQN